MKYLSLVIIFLFSLTGNASASSKARDVKMGNALYQEGDYDGSIEKYKQALEKDSEADITNFDAGTAYYKKEKYEDAITHLQKSLLSEDPGLKEKAHYNIGNAYYHSGIAQEEKNIDTAIAFLEQSLSHFENALKMDDKDADAGYNYEFVKKELKRLKEKKEQQQQQQQGQKKEKQQEQQEQQNQESQGSQKQQEQQAQEGQEDQEKQQEGQEAKDEQGDQGEDQQAVQEREQRDTGDEARAPEEMSRQEAQMLLDNYQQNEEPQGLLNFIKHKGKEVPVLKDW